MIEKDKFIPIVSICCVTYNHQNFIRQCVDGFVMQKTTFPIEILVHEDASTDNTANIVKDYELKYPNLFRCIYQTENQFKIQNTLTNILFPMARGKYIALCEGDDCWTDPYKLQKQVDFLEANKDFAICFHNTEERFEDENQHSFLYCNQNQKFECGLNDLAYSNFIPTCSVIFRNNLYGKLPDWIKSMPMGDWPLHIINAHYGKIKYIPHVMAVHRIHNTGVWFSMDSREQHQLVLSSYDILIEQYQQNKDFCTHLINGRNNVYNILNPPKKNNDEFQKAKQSKFISICKKIVKNCLPHYIVTRYLK